jgi:hypothetical protein
LPLYRLALGIFTTYLLLSDNPAVLLHLHSALHLHLILLHDILLAMPDHLLMHIPSADNHLIARVGPKHHFVFRLGVFFLFLLRIGRCRKNKQD